MQFQVQHLHVAFYSFAQNGKLKKTMLAKILQTFGYNEMQQNEILNKVNEEEISKNYRQFLSLFGYNFKPDMFINPYQVEEQIPIKYSKEMIDKIYEEFKALINEQNYEKLYNFLWNHKGLDLVNMVDQTTKQICTFIVVQLSNEILALKILSMLADYRVDFTFKDSLKQTILFYICRDGKLKLLDFVLSTNSVNLNDQDSHGQTPLFYAARENKIEIVQRLVFSGADVNIVDKLQHQTAIFYSAREGHLEICKILVESGCNPCHQDQQKKTALFFAKKFSKREVVEYLTQFLNKNKEDSQYANNESAQGEIPKLQKKRVKDLPKQAYKLLFTDEEGNQQEVTASEFQKFQETYPEIANLITNADQIIDDDLLNVAQEQDNWQKAALKVLQILWKAKGGQYFWAPVDVKKYGIADYYDVVKNPMDFGTVKKKLNANIYKQCREYYYDMLLVFDNCILYNGTENEVGQIGATLKQEFENLIQNTKLSKYLQ